MNATRDQLLGYVLGALEAHEVSAVEAALLASPQLRYELTRIQDSLMPLNFPNREDEIELDGPPLGLAERTCSFIADTIEELRVEIATPVPPSPAAKFSAVSPSEVGNEVRRFSWADWIVAASVLIAAGTLLFPAIASSRHSARVTACQNNLREVGVALEQFSNHSPLHAIPEIPLQGNRAVAGIYSVLLKDSGFLTEDSMLVCPGSDIAPRQTTAEPFSIPTLAQIDQAVGDTLVLLQRTMGGSYGYNLGYMNEGKHRTPSMRGQPMYPVMSDAPSTLAGVRKTRNHAGHGHNILYADNHVSYVVDLPDTLLDDPFHNRSGMIAAGEDSHDVVLGESFARPMPVFFQPQR